MSQLALSLFTNPPTVHTVKFQYSVGLFSLQAANFFPQETSKSNPHTRSMKYILNISRPNRISSTRSDCL